MKMEQEETPERREKRLARMREYSRKLREQQKATETEQEREERRAYYRLMRRMYRERETPEQREKRRAQARAYYHRPEVKARKLARDKARRKGESV